jgi:hypothetical protein
MKNGTFDTMETCEGCLTETLCDVTPIGDGIVVPLCPECFAAQDELDVG